MKLPEIDSLKSYLRAVGTKPDDARAILAAANGVDKPLADRLIITRVAAEILECHPKTVLRYRKRGLLHPVRRSSRFIRWRESEVRRLALNGVSA